MRKGSVKLSQYDFFTILSIAGFAVSAICLSILLVYNKWRTERLVRSPNINRNRNIFYFLFWCFNTIPGVNNVFQKVLKNTEILYPADRMSINQEATKSMAKSSGIVIIMVVYTLLVSRGDIWFIAMGVIASICFFHKILTGTYKKKQDQLLDQMKVMINHLKHHYENKAIVEDALEDCIGEVPHEIELHVEKIHKIITSPTMEAEIEDYVNTSPNSNMLMFLMICASCKVYSNGERSFIESLTYLEEEINQEKMTSLKIKEKFKFLEPICLGTVFFIKPAEIWVSNDFTGSAGFYSSMAGKAVLIGLFIMIFILYFLIDALQNIGRRKIKENSIYKKMANTDPVSGLLNRYINKKFTKTMKLDEYMKEVGDHTTPKAFYFKQLVFALLGFMLVFSGTVTGILSERKNAINNFTKSYDNSIVVDEKYRQTMEQASSHTAKKYKSVSAKKLDRDEIAEYAIKDGLKENYAYMVADKVIEQLDEYHQTYYRFWMLLLAIAGAAVGFYTPMLYLKFELFLSKGNKKMEVSQFQTLILIFMSSDGIRLDTILEWMERFAYSFKPTISECIISLESGEKKALEKMKNQEESSDEFIRFVDCLEIMIDNDIHTAFEDIQVDRAYMLKEREFEINKIINQRASWASFMAMAPAMLVIFGYLVAPMGTLVGKMESQMNLNID